MSEHVVEWGRQSLEKLGMQVSKISGVDIGRTLSENAFVISLTAATTKDPQFVSTHNNPVATKFDPNQSRTV